MLQPTDDLSFPHLFKFLHGADGGKIETPELACLVRIRGTCQLPNLFKQIYHRAFSDKSGAYTSLGCHGEQARYRVLSFRAHFENYGEFLFSFTPTALRIALR